MTRASAWYKRNTQYWTLLIAAIVVVALNADTIRVSRALSGDATLRALVAAQAREFVDANPSKKAPGGADAEDPSKKLALLATQLNAQLPIGWPPKATLCHVSPREGLEWLVGCAMTVLAISLGAPFWFDILSKVATVRFNGQSPTEGPAPTKGQAPAAAP